MSDLQPVWTPNDYANTIMAVQQHNRMAALIANMRMNASALEATRRLWIEASDGADYNWSFTCEKAAQWLRYEADYLERRNQIGSDQ